MERSVTRVFRSRPTLEGAGVRLRRVFGFNEVPLFDPFLMLDDFSSADPSDYLAGFPWHPHRGIETVTYLRDGAIEHGDSLGNRGTIGPGDVQWMTAGSGVIHQEMPKRTREGIVGFQLWVNLPSSSKMMKPRYRDVRAADIPEVVPAPNVRVRVIAGEVAGTRGPVRDIVVAPEYLDVDFAGQGEFVHRVPGDHAAFVYVRDGGVDVGGTTVARGHAAFLGPGERVRLTAAGPAGLLLVAGRPLREPVAWRGPIVMNNDGELAVAFDEYRRGTFVKHGKDPERQ